ncbi:cysteine proteinase [Auricularia subglabra TFB-10046 SS5]|uniref:Cysteine proteinase n=1 Tax=Auricularia subglabra (strain TFB-10046 / SS5) TaxID=717982 RepID=J0WSL2_AURST|nr:cysteine proteinase [Auricularia subglabra TFB-10046 SS5]
MRRSSRRYTLLTIIRRRELRQLQTMDVRGCRALALPPVHEAQRPAPALLPLLAAALPPITPSLRRVRFADTLHVREPTAEESDGDQSDTDDDASDSDDTLEEMGSPRSSTVPLHIHLWPDLDNLAAAAQNGLGTANIVIGRTSVCTGSVVRPASSARLINGRQWLNGELIDAGISVLASEYPQRLERFCVLSSYEMTRYADGTDVQELHRHVDKLAPWSRTAVIVPINEENTHWLLAVVWPTLGYVEVFDSLGRPERMQRHAKDEQDRARQCNGYDCGLWTLAVVAGLLNGKHVTGLQESDMLRVRLGLATLLCKYGQNR